MTKKFLTFGILLIVITGILLPTHTTHAGEFFPDLEDAINSFVKLISLFLMGLSALVLTFCGMIFDWIVNYTIIEMGKNVGDLGIGASITTAWAALRDVANMCFIFVLLFAAFKAMFDTNFGNFGTTVKNIIIVALLINFSLFFSKIVIDASNIVSVGFYKSIITNELDISYSVTEDIKASGALSGISAGYMKMLGIQNFFSDKFIDSKNMKPIPLLTMGVMSSILMLIVAVIFLISAIMFASRFIILVFLMILSPLALIAFIIPGQQGQFNKWKESLISQSFFAPLFFALTWVVFKLGTALINANQTTGQWTDLTTKPAGVIPLLFNYVLIIGFSIAALVISKQMATSGATSGVFKAISGGIGTAAIGGAALAGRNTIGRASSLVSEKYRDTLSKNALGRSTLWLANKGKQSSFDARAVGDTKLMKSIGADKYANDMLGTAGKAGGKGGYKKMAEEKAKAKAAYAKDVYGKTDKEKEEEKEAKEKYEKGENKKNFDSAVEQEKKIVTEAEKNAADEKKKAEEDLKTKKEAEKKADPLNPAARDAAKRATAEAERVLREKETAHNESITKKKSVLDDKNYSEATKALEKLAEQDKKAWEDIQNASANRLESYAKRLERLDNMKGIAIGAVTGGVLGSVGGTYGAAMGAGIGAGLGKGGKESARAVRKMIKGKTEEEELAELAEKIAKKKIKADDEKNKSEEPSEPPK